MIAHLAQRIGMGFQRATPFFRGAYFRKVTSAAGDFHGIVGRIQLPSPIFDPTGWYRGDDNSPTADFTNCHLDCPSVYLGGHAGTLEVDAGLSWDRRWHLLGGGPTGTFTDLPGRCDGGDPSHRFHVRPGAAGHELVDANNNVVAQGSVEAALLTGLTPNFAYRIFWRVAEWHNPEPAGSGQDLYFYAGESVELSLVVISDGNLRLDICSAGATFSTQFVASEFRLQAQQSFKRVVSLDQYFLDAGNACKCKGNEQKQMIPTNTQLRGANWAECSMLTAAGACLPVAGAAFVEVPGTDTAPDYDEIFQTSGLSANGAEKLDIFPPVRVANSRLGSVCPNREG